MNIALYTDSDAFAGTERHMLDLALALQEAGENVRLACPGDSPLAQHGHQHRLSVVDIPKRGMVDRTAARTLARLLRHGDVDIVHAHNGRTHVAAVMAIRQAGRGACVATQHFMTPSREQRRGPAAWASRTMHAWAARHTDRFIAISQAVAEGMRRRGDAPVDKVRVIHNGIGQAVEEYDDARRRLHLAPDLRLVLCISRLEAEKDVATLVAAMAQVRAGNVQCWVAGRGSQYDALDEHVRAAGLQETVRLLGHRSDATTLMAACDVCVQPCPVEGFGMVLLEAMAQSRPVVAVAAGGPLEIVEDGVTGMLVPPSDSGAMARAVQSLLASAELRQAMGRAGRQRFDSLFTRERMGQATLAVYREVVP